MPHFFVDESGNLGFAFDSGSSKHFVLVLLQVDDPETLREFVQKIRVQQRLPERYEFKYRRVGSKRVLRSAFFPDLARLKFTAWALVVDKQRLSAGLMALDRYSFYGWALGELVAEIPQGAIENSTMVIDEPSRSGKFVRSMRIHISRTLRGMGRKQGFRKITGRDSEREDGIQCADMLAGALAAYVSVKDSWAYRQVESKFAKIIYRPETKNIPG